MDQRSVQDEVETDSATVALERYAQAALIITCVLMQIAGDSSRRLMGTMAFLRSRDERKRVEMRFAQLKIDQGLERILAEVSPVPR